MASQDADLPVPIKKSRSLETSYDGWGTGHHKHFRVNGADPTDLPSQGKIHSKTRRVCKGSPDKNHHFEVICERVYWRSEHMVDQCIYCGKKDGYGFTVWIVKPDWIKKMEQRKNGRI